MFFDFRRTRSEGTKDIQKVGRKPEVHARPLRASPVPKLAATSVPVPITILVKLQEPDEPFRTLRAVGYTLDREWKTFSLRGYNADRKREEAWSKSMNCRLQFDLGGVSAGNVIWLDNVRLEEDWLE